MNRPQVPKSKQKRGRQNDGAPTIDQHSTAIEKQREQNSSTISSFVANLTVFTYVHHINTRETLTQYIGFFTVLWFTWYQVSLYDVRFAMDSVLARVAKLCHFAVMLGFAIVSPNFTVGKLPDSTENSQTEFNAFRTLTLFLMAGRFTLMFQYLTTMWFTRKYKGTLVPFGAIAATYFAAAVVYLGMYFSFYDEGDRVNWSFVGWYVVAFLETVIVTTISSVWRVISFKGTHIVERMSLLTLIILGEGIIGLAKQCQIIAKSKILHYFPSIWAFIICMLLALYLLYMLYFDWAPEKHFGTIRQQVWAFMHFPLHLVLVLAVEGLGQCIAWREAVIVSYNLWEEALETYHINSTNFYTQPTSFFHHAASHLNETAIEYFSDTAENGQTFEVTASASTRLSIALDAVNTINITQTTSEEAVHNAQNAIIWIYQNLQIAVFELTGFEPPESPDYHELLSVDFNNTESGTEAIHSLVGELNDLVHVFQLTYIYFFVCIGLVVILISVMGALTRKYDHTVGHVVRSVLTCLLGLGLALLTTMVASESNGGDYSIFTGGSSSYYFFITSPWYLPTVVITLFIIVLVNNLPLPKEESRVPFIPSALEPEDGEMVGEEG